MLKFCCILFSKISFPCKASVIDEMTKAEDKTALRMPPYQSPWRRVLF
jgi:hypothetical protein